MATDYLADPNELSMQATFAHPVRAGEIVGFLRGAPSYATVTIKVEDEASPWAFVIEAKWSEIDKAIQPIAD